MPQSLVQAFKNKDFFVKKKQRLIKIVYDNTGKISGIVDLKSDLCHFPIAPFEVISSTKIINDAK